MNVSDPEHEITGTESIINVSDVKARAARLRPYHVYVKGTTTSLSSHSSREEAEQWMKPAFQEMEVGEDLDESAELTALQTLLNDLGDLGNDSYLIHNGYLEEYAQDDNELSEDSPLFMYVDWKRVTDDHYRDNLAKVISGTASTG